MQNLIYFLVIEVPDDILVERCCGRRTDPVTGKIYHLKFNPPPQDHEVLNRLVHRADDNEDSMK
jgi:adenylate kinase